MMIVESRLSSRALGRGLEMPLLMSIGRALFVALGVYGAARLRRPRPARRARPGVLARAARPSFFQLELAIGVILPMALLALPAVRRNSGRLYGAALLVVAGFVVNRLNVSITALEGAQGGHYVPALAEGVVTIMLVAIGIAAFGLAVRFLPVMAHVEQPELGPAPAPAPAAAAGPVPREDVTTPLHSAAALARRLRPWRRLAVRMGLGLCLGAAAILYVADQLSLERQRAQLEGLVALSADRTAGIVHRATHDGMLRNDADGVRRIIANIAAQEGVDSVRIYNKEGRVRVSSRPGEEGTLVDKRSRRVHRLPRRAQPKAGLERADRIRMLQAPRRRPRARRDHADLQRARLHLLPRAPGRAARARDPRRAAVDGAGGRRARRLQAPDAVRPLRDRARRPAAELRPALGVRDAPGQAAARRDGARRRRRPRRPRAGAAPATRWETSPAPGTR